MRHGIIAITVCTFIAGCARPAQRRLETVAEAREAMTPIDHILQAPQLARVAPQLRPLLLWSIRIETSPASDDELPLGGTKFGGSPDLPEGLEWPMYSPPPDPVGAIVWPDSPRRVRKTPTPIPLVAQIRLSDVAPFDREHAFPAKGLLWFFCDPFGMYQLYELTAYSDPNNCRVLYWPDESAPLRRRTPPAEMHPERPWRARSLRFRAEQTLPHVETTWIGNKGGSDGVVRMSGDEWLAYAELRSEWIFRNVFRHRLLGYSDDVQPMLLERGYHNAREVLFPELWPPKDVHDPALDDEFRRGRLLLQVESHDDMEFGRWGCGAFFIREDDLKAARFDRVWFNES